MLRPAVWAAFGLALVLPDAAVAQRRPAPDDRGRDDGRPGWNRGDDRDRNDDRSRTPRKRRPAPDFGGVSLGLYGGGVDGMPTGGVRLGVGLVRLYAEGSDDERYGDRDEPEQAAFGIDLTLPARHPGLRALYGIAGVGVQTREQDVYYVYEGGYICDDRVADCIYPAYGSSSERDSRFYGTLGLGMKLPLWRGRVALTGEVAGRFVADRYDGGYVAPTANVGVSVRLR